MRLKFKTEKDAEDAYELIVTSGLFLHEFLDGCEIVCEGDYYDVDWVLCATWSGSPDTLYEVWDPKWYEVVDLET